MRDVKHLLAQNHFWATAMAGRDPEYFKRLARQQKPEYLWIGCADSRLPAEMIMQLSPGELFVHRNVANLVLPNDLNCLSVLQFAVDVLQVKHVIVCGHYGCGGVGAAWAYAKLGLVDDWLQNVQNVRESHAMRLAGLGSDVERIDRLCELNVIEQVANTCRTPMVQEAWGRGQGLSVHGWIYRVEDGLLHDLELTVTSPAQLQSKYEAAVNGAPGASFTARPGASGAPGRIGSGGGATPTSEAKARSHKTPE
jgi:carbonic anhydrase